MKASVGTVNKALIEGSILVLIVLYLLLNSIRGSIVVLIALPLSLLATFIVMKLAGISANLMSLGGLGDFHRHDHRRNHHSGGERPAASQ